MRLRVKTGWLLFFACWLCGTYANPILSFKQAVQMAYQNNPELQMQIAQAHSARGQVVQSYRYLNPSVSLEAENIGGSGSFKGFESAETTLSISQPFPLGGKWGYQQIVAKANWCALLASVARKKSEIFIAVGHAYVEVLYARQWYLITGKLVQLNQAIVQDVEKRMASGVSKKLDQAFAELDLANEKITQQRALRELKQAQSKLAQLLGQGSQARYQLQQHTIPHRLSSWQAIKKQMQHSIVLKEKRLFIDVARKMITATKRNIWPTLSVQIGARHFNDDKANALVVSATSALPVYNRNQGNLVSAEANYTAAVKTYQMEKLALEQRVYSQFVESQQRFQEATMVKNQLLPMAEDAQKLAQQGYAQGIHSFADLTLAMRRLILEQRHYNEAHADVEKANITIHGLLIKAGKDTI